MRSSSAHAVDHGNPTHFITKHDLDLGWGLLSRVADKGWTEVDGRSFFETRKLLVAALERTGYRVVGTGAWEPNAEQRALAEIRTVVDRIQWKVKPGSLLPEEGLTLIRDILSREGTHA